MSALRVAIVAGETSGDALGGALIAALRARVSDAQFLGVAGPAMRAAGCEPLADAHELAVMGLTEVLGHLPRLLRLRARLLQRIIAWRPDVFIGIDYQQFNLGLALRLKRRGFVTVQYVSPQVWAWRAGRVHTMAQAYDLVLCLLPFEPTFYAEHALRARFVGHPLADQIPLHPDRAAARASLQLEAQAPVLALLPGSRASEMQRLAIPFIGAATLLARQEPGLVVLAPMAGPKMRVQFERALAQRPEAPAVRVLDGQSRLALSAADVALVASGTATLEALLCRCPMVVAYRFNALTAWVVRRLRLVRTAHFALPNLLAREPLAPEFLQEQVTSPALAAALAQALHDTARRAYLLTRFRAIHESLRCDGAALAAQAVLELLQERGWHSAPLSVQPAAGC
jgi:lipid-A-disaccharide synthase